MPRNEGYWPVMTVAEFVALVVKDLQGRLLHSSGDPHLDSVANAVVRSDGNGIVIEFTVDGRRREFTTSIEPNDIASGRPSLVATTVLIEFEEEALSDD